MLSEINENHFCLIVPNQLREYSWLLPSCVVWVSQTHIRNFHCPAQLMQMLLLPSPLPSPSRPAAVFAFASPLSHPHCLNQLFGSTNSLSYHPLSRRIHSQSSFSLRSLWLAQSPSQTTTLASHPFSQRIHLHSSLPPHWHLFSSSLVRAAPASGPSTGYPSADEQSEMEKLAQVLSLSLSLARSLLSPSHCISDFYIRVIAVFPPSIFDL